MEVTVVGAGVIGLVTALALEQRGHRVRIVAAETGDATTSAVAGAVWFPYRAGPKHAVAAWAARTRDWLEQLARDAPEAGVDVLAGYEITREEDDDGERPWWAANIDVERTPAPVTGAPPAWRFRAPRAEPARFLPYLASRLAAPIERRAVIDLAAERGDIVVNCTGLGARELVGDDALFPLFGQVAIADRGDVDLGVTITDHRVAGDGSELFYVIPRRDSLVLGGCSRPYPPGAPVELDRELTARVVAHARALGLAIGAIRRERAGLRPYRAEVRIARDGRVVHHYGHGGAGFTLCWGCAEEVVRWVER
ncbi:MAG TPA: FAD-dependent oxidoreductase [Kofleriaceae bacterium]|nr:FAD-dependent oxidoreductase [Kofleriaceae bacterium]